MNHRSARIYIILLVIALFFATFKFEYAEAAGKLPVRIMAFYDNYNYVSAFSTPEERAALTYSSRRAPVSKSRPESTDRLSAVQQLTEKIKRTIWRLDPGIAITSRLSVKIQPAELVWINKFQQKRDGVLVWVDIYPIHPELNFILVSEYDKKPGTKNSPLIEKQLSRIQSEIHRTEIHHWLKMNDQWMLTEARILLLE